VPSYGQNFSAKPSGVRGSDLRADIRFVVIGFALAGAIGGAAAQYFPPQPPPAGYPPSAHDPYPASPPPSYQRLDPYPDTAGEPYDDQYDWPYPAQPLPTIGDTQRQPPDGIISEPLAPPATSPQDRGTEVAALPPEYQPERGPPVELRPQFRRTVVDYPTIETPGTIIIDTPNTTFT
jgi:lipoprotein-anchoring transpeptidase ErfK/SrfK